MFICIECHDKMREPKAQHDFKDSWGICEMCGHNAGCADCRCYHLGITGS